MFVIVRVAYENVIQVCHPLLLSIHLQTYLTRSNQSAVYRLINVTAPTESKEVTLNIAVG
jgi:hypothetical protein